MTNREILKTSKQVLTELERQRHFVLQVDGTPMPCPACQTKVNLFDAAGIDIDNYDFGNTKHAYRCPSCGAELEQVIPIIAISGHWLWRLKQSWLQEVMRKARAFDQLQANESEAKT